MPIRQNAFEFGAKYLIGDANTVIANGISIFNTINDCLNYIQADATGNRIGKIYVLPKSNNAAWVEQINLVGDFDWSDLEIEFDKKAKLTSTAEINGTGQVYVSSSSPRTVVGIGTTFLTEFKIGQYIKINNLGTYEVASIESDTSLTLANDTPIVGVIGSGGGTTVSGSSTKFLKLSYFQSLIHIPSSITFMIQSVTTDISLTTTATLPSPFGSDVYKTSNRTFTIIKPVINIGMGGGYYYGLYDVNTKEYYAAGGALENFQYYKYVANIGKINLTVGQTSVGGFGTRFTDYQASNMDKIYVAGIGIGISGVGDDDSLTLQTSPQSSQAGNLQYFQLQSTGGIIGNYFKRDSGLDLTEPSYSSSTQFFLMGHNKTLSIIGRENHIGIRKTYISSSNSGTGPNSTSIGGGGGNNAANQYKHLGLAFIKRYYKNIKIKVNVEVTHQYVPALKVYGADTIFEGNISGCNNASAVVLKGANVTVDGVIENCGQSTQNYYIDGGAANVIASKFKCTSIRRCNARWGGGIYSYYSILNIGSIKECKADNSTITGIIGKGGGAYLDRTSAIIEEIDSCTAQSSTGTSTGGGVLAVETNLQLNVVSNCHSETYGSATTSDQAGQAVAYGSNCSIYINDFGGNGSYNNTISSFGSTGSNILGVYRQGSLAQNTPAITDTLNFKQIS